MTINIQDLHIDVNIDLLKKYERSGPRYTSYPTAPYFHEAVDADAYIAYMDHNNQVNQGKDLSLYFHLPFCDTLCYFCGCNMLVTKNPERIDQYIDYLIREMDLLLRHMDRTRQVAQLHWGGGTPTSLSPKQIRRLGKAIHERFGFRELAEVSVEIDPRELTHDHILALAEIGFNRCSIGVQDFNPQVQQAVHRIQPEDITLKAIEWARASGFESINVDLMYGLPFQTFEDFKQTIDTVVRFDPDRLAVFNYAHLPKMIKHQRLIPEDALPGAEEKLQLLKLSIDALTAAGYIYIGMDHFSRPDDELTRAMLAGTLYRNFQGYSTHAGLDLYAIGMSSISMLPELYIQNHKILDDYYARIDAGVLPVKRGYRLSQDDILRREVIMQLMCNFKLEKAEIEKKFDIDFDAYFAPALDAMDEFIADKMLSLAPGHIEIHGPGRLLIRNIVMNFDAYLQNQSGPAPQYSKTV